MIGVFVRDENRVDAVRAAAAERFESTKHFAAAKAGINEESRVFRFEQRAVARAAGGKNGDPERDASALGGVERELPFDGRSFSAARNIVRKPGAAQEQKRADSRKMRTGSG
jgi:hypothetical protein